VVGDSVGYFDGKGDMGVGIGVVEVGDKDGTGVGLVG